MPLTAEHIVVVGAGAFGGWTALALRRAGARVTLIDAWGAGHSRASSGGETRVIRAIYGGVAPYTDMAARALGLWREAERRWGVRVLFQSGVLWMCESDDGYVRRSLGHMEAAGLPVTELGVAETRRRFPQFAMDDVRAAFFEPEAGFIAARRSCDLVRDELLRSGGTYLQDWARPGEARGAALERVLLSGEQALQADRFVFACGPWLPQVFPDLLAGRITPTRQEVFFFSTPPGAGDYRMESFPAWVHIGERLLYGLPDHDGRGVKLADDTAGEAVEPTTLHRSPSAASVERARAQLARRFPALRDAPVLETRVCQYEASSDGHFILDRHPRYENVWLAGGGSGHGFKMGPALGEHVAALVLGRAAPIPMFRLARFG